MTRPICRRIADKIEATQTALGRTILIENPATYLRFKGDSLDETQFLTNSRKNPAAACCSTSTMSMSAR